MTPDEYQAFTDVLLHNLAQDQRVIGLIALGSMARANHDPDQWSDHDFFVIVETGQQEAFRTDLGWLPSPEQIVYGFRETEHGLKVVYRNGHLIEFAVLDRAELATMRMNASRVLLDRAEITALVGAVCAATAEWLRTHRESDASHFGQFAVNLLIGVGRHQRGEQISARRFVKEWALIHLIALITAHVPTPERHVLDSLDPSRRFEVAYPEIGREINRLLSEDTPFAARGLLDLADRLLVDRMPDYPREGAAVIRRRLEDCGSVDL